MVQETITHGTPFIIFSTITSQVTSKAYSPRLKIHKNRKIRRNKRKEYRGNASNDSLHKPCKLLPFESVIRPRGEREGGRGGVETYVCVQHFFKQILISDRLRPEWMTQQASELKRGVPDRQTKAYCNK